MTATGSPIEKPASRLRDMLATLKGVALDARKRVADLDTRIAELRAKRAELEIAPPHIDDVAGWACRNIDRHAAHYARRAELYLHPWVLKEKGWSALDNPELWRTGFAWFRVDYARNSDMPVGQVSPQDPDNVMHGADNFHALTALLAPLLKERVKPFLLQMRPELQNGVPRAERDEKLAAIDAQLRELSIERQDILDHLGKAAHASN